MIEGANGAGRGWPASVVATTAARGLARHRDHGILAGENLLAEFLCHLWVFLEEEPGLLPALPQVDIAVSQPGARLIDKLGQNSRLVPSMVSRRGNHQPSATCRICQLRCSGQRRMD